MTEPSVLIVEDRPDIAAYLSSAVEAMAEVGVAGVAGTLDQGMTMLFETRPRLVLVDLGLPDGSGLDIVRACAGADWQVDAMVVSIFGDERRAVAAIQAGAKGYLLKGAGLDQIASDIRAVLEGGSPISPAIARHFLGMLAKAPVADEGGPSPLTERETEILRAVARGYKRHEIAARLGISTGTVSNHITSIYRKLEVSTNIEAVALASRLGAL